MTRIRISREGDHYTLDLKGHTDTRICAGISILLCTLRASLTCDDEVYGLEAQIAHGDTHLDFNTRSVTALNDLDFVMIGLYMLQQTYPDKVKLEENFFQIHAF